MNFPSLTSPANLIAWARDLRLALDRREALLGTLYAPQTYADDAAAGAAGVASGQFYKSDDGAGGFSLKVKA